MTSKKIPENEKEDSFIMNHYHIIFPSTYMLSLSLKEKMRQQVDGR